MINVLAAIFLLVHGLGHLPGFAGRWRLSARYPYTTTILAGRLDVGRIGTRVVGALWLLLVIDFALVAWLAYAGASWWMLGVLEAASGSLVLCLVDWPETSIGVAVDVVLIVIATVWWAGLGLIRIG